jgi:protein-disulfide isomerase
MATTKAGTTKAGPAPRGKKPRVQAPQKRGSSKPASRGRTYGIALGAAALVAVVLIAVSVFGSGGGGSSTPASLTGAAETAALLKGIPQSGTTLGSSKAPVTLVEYADIQCPYCGVWARDVFPTIVRKYVRTGRVRMELNGLTFVGPDSERALRTALAGGEQNRFWNVMDMLYRNQGQENSGWVTDSVLKGALAAVPGLDVEQAWAARNGDSVTAQLAKAKATADAAGINSTPTFQAGKTGGTLERLELDSLDADSFGAKLDAILNR